MAIIGTIGRDITPIGGFGGGDRTYIVKRDPATASGKLYAVTIEITAHDTPHTPNLKIFRINGTNYDVIYNQVVSGMSDGENTITLTTPVSILVGDLLGYYIGAVGAIASIAYEAGAGSGMSFKTTNITTTTAIVDWTTSTETIGLRGNIMSIPAGGFSGGQPWIFMKDMWEKHSKIWKPKGLILPKEGFSY